MTGTMTDNVIRMQGLYEAFSRGDIPTVLAGMHEHVEWHEAEGNPWHPGRPFVGPQEVLAGVFQRVAAEFEGFEVVPTRFLGLGDTVVVEGRLRARSHLATGKALDAEAVHLWDLRNGRITRFHEYIDTRQFAGVAGAAG